MIVLKKVVRTFIKTGRGGGQRPFINFIKKQTFWKRVWSLRIRYFANSPCRYQYRYRYISKVSTIVQSIFLIDILTRYSCSICQIPIDSIFYRYRYFAKHPHWNRYRYRYLSKVSIYRQSIFLIDISNRATTTPSLTDEANIIA